ncbi:hypothetical protein ACH5RR_010210 [Cinchona calisaya]|uniref:Small ribosomal subunit protein bS18c n=1 Tax=Cinchona calisaya TaxID=153742 RepID=A0ABD3AHP0_9GENT
MTPNAVEARMWWLVLTSNFLFIPTQISAKAQRKIAREIKTARAFGLMPFTTVGTKEFVFGKTMENRAEEFEFEMYHPRNFVDIDGTENPLKA